MDFARDFSPTRNSAVTHLSFLRVKRRRETIHKRNWAPHPSDKYVSYQERFLVTPEGAPETHARHDFEDISVYREMEMRLPNM